MKKHHLSYVSKFLISLILCMGILLPINVSALEYAPISYNEYDSIVEKINTLNQKIEQK